MIRIEEREPCEIDTKKVNIIITAMNIILFHFKQKCITIELSCSDLNISSRLSMFYQPIYAWYRSGEERKCWLWLKEKKNKTTNEPISIHGLLTIERTDVVCPFVYDQSRLAFIHLLGVLLFLSVHPLLKNISSLWRQ